MRDARGFRHIEEEAQIDEIEAHRRLPSGFAHSEARPRNFQIVSRGFLDQAGDMPSDHTTLVLAGLTFVLAGFVKGVTGMGLPTVAIGLLGLVMAPAEAAALLIIPSTVTNIWQFVAGSYRLLVLRRTASLLMTSSVATYVAAGLLAGASTSSAEAALGVALLAYAILGLSGRTVSVPPRREPLLSPMIGALTGLVAGATGVFVLPAVPYLQALGLGKEELVQALGLSFTVSTLALAAGLARHGAFHVGAAGSSLLYTVPALIGMHIGQWGRARVDPATFRRLFFIALLILGADLAARAFA
jgi:uncharacterized membrane protein YfcA